MKTINKNKKKSYLTLSARSSSLFRPLLFSFFIALLFALFLSCECTAGTDNNPISNNSEEDVTPADNSIISLSTNTLYETEATDNGSFDQTIDINPSLSSVFDTVLFNYPGDSTDPVGVSELPTGLGVILTKTNAGVQLRLAGNAESHARHIHNTSVEVTFLSNFFQTSELYTPADVSFSFDIVYGSKGGWLPREGHQAFSYDNKIWILGGSVSGSIVENDIWTSADNGTNWTQVSVNGTHWSKRTYYQAFAYNNKVWVLGGKEGITGTGRLNDIWTSADSGITWTEVSPPETHWAVREEHQAFVYNDKIWVLAGLDDSSVWNSSDDGVTWNQVSPTGTYWSTRFGHQAFIYRNKIWVLGGYSDSRKKDIWTSADNGITWAEVSPTGTYWSARNKYQAFVYNDKIWVLGGLDGNYKNDIWSSADEGTNWTPVSPTGTYWSARYGHQAFVYDDKLWVIGGRDSGGYKNDIWSSADEGETWQTWQTFGEFY